MTTSGDDPGDAAAVGVSSDGGATWDVLHTCTGIAGESSASGSYDISGFISGQTLVRLRITNLYGGRSEYFKVDRVEVSYSTAICGNRAATSSVGFGPPIFGPGAHFDECRCSHPSR